MGGSAQDIKIVTINDSTHVWGAKIFRIIFQFVWFFQPKLPSRKRNDTKWKLHFDVTAKKFNFLFVLLQLFKEDPDTGLTHVALSSDSTCTNHLYSSQDGYETLHLEKLEPPAPASTTVEAPAEPTCSFPEWMQGKWENLHINGGELTYRDENNFVTYRGKCLESVDRDESGSTGLRYLLHLTTDCGAPSLNCALFHRRDSNVMEFQLGKDRFLFSVANLPFREIVRPLSSNNSFTLKILYDYWFRPGLSLKCWLVNQLWINNLLFIVYILSLCCC